MPPPGNGRAKHAPFPCSAPGTAGMQEKSVPATSCKSARIVRQCHAGVMAPGRGAGPVATGSDWGATGGGAASARSWRREKTKTRTGACSRGDQRIIRNKETQQPDNAATGQRSNRTTQQPDNSATGKLSNQERWKRGNELAAASPTSVTPCSSTVQVFLQPQPVTGAGAHATGHRACPP
jgi:hypothetical protein